MAFTRANTATNWTCTYSIFKTSMATCCNLCMLFFHSVKEFLLKNSSKKEEKKLCGKILQWAASITHPKNAYFWVFLDNNACQCFHIKCKQENWERSQSMHNPLTRPNLLWLAYPEFKRRLPAMRKTGTHHRYINICIYTTETRLCLQVHLIVQGDIKLCKDTFWHGQALNQIAWE